MSWRSVARRVRECDSDRVEQDCPPPPMASAVAVRIAPASDGYALHEREAIAEHDGGLPQSWAVALAALHFTPRPHGIPARDWQWRLDYVCRRADRHALEFAANGWTFEEVFGVGEHWLRLDERGAAWLAPDARIVEITPDRIVFERGHDRSTHRKCGRPI